MGYRVTEKRLGDPSHLKVVMIGGGASGMNLARHMELYMQNYELAIYEKNADIGGTWFENKYEPLPSFNIQVRAYITHRYPGCACDIPSHNYQFTWEPNPDWTRLYVSL